MPCKCSVFPQDAFPLSHLPSALSPHTVAQRFIQGHMLDSDVMNLKVQLRNRLNSCRLSNMPGGFPFHHVFDGHGSAHLSSDSYEFREEFRTSTFDQLPRYQKATISFTSPNSTRNKRNYLSWRAFLPTLDPSYCRGACGALCSGRILRDSQNLPRQDCCCRCPGRARSDEHSVRELYQNGSVCHSSCFGYFPGARYHRYNQVLGRYCAISSWLQECPVEAGNYRICWNARRWPSRNSVHCQPIMSLVCNIPPALINTAGYLMFPCSFRCLFMGKPKG